MAAQVTALSDVRENRITQAWELAGLEPPESLTVAARIAAHCLSCAKRKAKLVAQQALWEVKHTESLNLVACMLGFPSWRDLQTYAKQFHTLTQQQWRSDTLSLRLVSACWLLTPKQQKYPAAQSVLTRKLQVVVPGVSPESIQGLIRSTMCDQEAADGEEQEETQGAGVYWPRSHYRERFVAQIAAGADPGPLKANALGMLKKMAPTLPPEVGRDLVDYCLGGPETDLLIAHHAWLWPRASSADVRLWGHEHRHAAESATRLQAELERTTVGGWLCDAEMTDLRRWQETYLEGPKSRSRWAIVERLVDTFKDAGAVPPEVAREFMDWRKAMHEEILRQQNLASLPPIPHHLQYLAEMTFIRLDALFDFYDTSERTDRAAGVAAILKAAAGKPQMPNADSIAEELCPEEHRRYHYPSFEEVRGLMRALARRIEALVDQPAELKKFTARWELDTPKAHYRCKPCNSRESRTVTAGNLPPFIPHCYCREIRWVSSVLEREQAREWDRPYVPDECLGFAEYYTDVMWWALHRWLRLSNVPEFPTIPAAMLVREIGKGRL